MDKHPTLQSVLVLGVMLFFFQFVTPASAQYELQIAFPNVQQFSKPIDLQTIPDGTNRFVVAQQNGRVYILTNNESTSTKKLMMDISDSVTNNSEMGLLGCAFHPKFTENHHVYFNYTHYEGGILRSFISRFTVTGANYDTVLRSSELRMLTIDQPYENHNGGGLQFGPDGYLYCAFGDGGSGGDPQGNGQNTRALLGKILRIDVDHQANGKSYAIPASNPFKGNTVGNKEEIYAYGLRNPWRFSFDKLTGTLWCGDVGQGKWEEIDTIENGKNYGWNELEGRHCYGSPTCDSTGMTMPIWEYDHNTGVSITGGYVYRGVKSPDLVGKYIYGDYNGKVWALSAGQTISNQQLGTQLTFGISSFGVLPDGEVVILHLSNGRIYKIVSTASPTDNIPPKFIHRHGLQSDTLDITDNGPTDLGLKSISWKAESGTDTSKFTIRLEPPVVVNGDKQSHRLIITRKDLTADGCFDLLFEDAAGNKAYDTICFQAGTDNIAPKVTRYRGAQSDTIDITDNGPSDVGLKSIIWKAEVGTDTTRFSVIHLTPIAPNGDKTTHRVIVRQLDMTRGGCFDFVFEDLSGNKTFDTICFNSHQIIVSAPEIGKVTVNESKTIEATIRITPPDRSKVTIDSIWLEQSGSDYTITALSPFTSTAFEMVGNQTERVSIRFQPTVPGFKTAVLRVHTVNTADSIHSVGLEAEGMAIVGVSPEEVKSLELSITPNPFFDRTTISVQNASGAITLSLVDILGNTIHLRATEKLSFIASDYGLHPGIYWLVLTDASSTIVRKVVCLH